MRSEGYARLWSTALIVLGAGLLAVAFVAALRIVLDPGGAFDRWVPADQAAGPEASFSWTAIGRRVEFRNTSTAGDAGLSGRVWYFGDGETSGKANPTHTYGEDGEYAVRLEVTDDAGLTGRAEAAIGVEGGVEGAGQGERGLAELADSVTATVANAAKGIGVVVLVIGLFVVMVMAGGRLLRHGVGALRPIPERVSVKVRPRELERELRVDFDAEAGTSASRRGSGLEVAAVGAPDEAHGD